jgi:hypothetical protein
VTVDEERFWYRDRGLHQDGRSCTSCQRNGRRPGEASGKLCREHAILLEKSGRRLDRIVELPGWASLIQASRSSWAQRVRILPNATLLRPACPIIDGK